MRRRTQNRRWEKNVFLSEIWVVTSQNITKNAQEKLHKDHKTTNVSFIDGENLAKLIENYYPEYWDYQTAKLGAYVTIEQNKLTALGKNYSLLPPAVGTIRVEQQIYRIPSDSKSSFKLHTIPKTTTLIKELQKRRAIFIEGGMGSGKSELLRSTALSLITPDNLMATKIVPLFMTYREMKEKTGSIKELIEKVKIQVEDDFLSVALFVDGMDEIPDTNEEKVSIICGLSNDLLDDQRVKLVVASRNIDEITKRNELAKSFEMFAMAPLAFGSLLNFIQEICAGMRVSERLRSDLQKSPLLKALPRTPLSAILLAKLLSENVKDLPSTLPELYSKYTELVLGRWDIHKGNGSEKEYETIYRLTANLAAYMVDNNLDTIAASELKRIFKDYLDQRNTGQNFDSLFENFVNRREIIAYDSDNGTIQFRHRTFMEFFYSQNLYWQKGRNAPIDEPFHPYWKAIEYFYLGLVKDAPDRIKSLAALIPASEIEQFIKATQLGLFMLAAYQTPYVDLENALYRAFIESAELYCSICRGERNESPIAALPELQLLALITQSLKENYSYDFFKKALTSAKLKLALEPSPVREEEFVSEFFVDSVLAELGDDSAFLRLVDQHENELNWSLRLGISCSASDANFSNDAIRRVDKKLRRSLLNNPAMHRFIEEVERTPIKDRKAKIVANKTLG